MREQVPTNSDPAFSASVVVARRDSGGWRLLVLRACATGLSQGMLEPGEAPDAAIRETAEEAAISELDFRWGEGYCETAPYRLGSKVARYYVAETSQAFVTLPVSPELGRPEHDEWRWVGFDEAGRLLPPRLQPILAWARKHLEA
jgi:8-oxo-dGTP pyrophosphatase MutT (NUDIX family)